MSSVLFSTLVPLQLKVSFLGKLIILLAKQNINPAFPIK